MRAVEFINEDKDNRLVTIKTLGPQLYVPRKKNINENIKPNAKLWTSTAIKTTNGFTSDWIEWSKQEMPQWVSDTGTLYDVKPGARILHISTDRDVMRLAKQYKIDIKNPRELFTKMEWDIITGDFDAVHHTPSRDRFTNMFMSTWDVESTAWFNTNYLVNPQKVKVDTK